MPCGNNYTNIRYNYAKIQRLYSHDLVKFKYVISKIIQNVLTYLPPANLEYHSRECQEDSVDRFAQESPAVPISANHPNQVT